MVAFISWLLEALPIFLRAGGATIVKQMASKLSTRLGVVVPESIAGIMTAVRKWVEDNPKLALVIADIAVELGMRFDIEMLKKLFGGAAEGTFVKVATSKLLTRLAEQRALVTGDGSADTVNGATDGNGLTPEETVEANDIIDAAVRAIGSFEMFMTVRAAMFMEDDDLQLYGRLMQAR